MNKVIFLICCMFLSITLFAEQSQFNSVLFSKEKAQQMQTNEPEDKQNVNEKKPANSQKLALLDSYNDTKARTIASINLLDSLVMNRLEEYVRCKVASPTILESFPDGRMKISIPYTCKINFSDMPLNYGLRGLSFYIAYEEESKLLKDLYVKYFDRVRSNSILRVGLKGTQLYEDIKVFESDKGTPSLTARDTDRSKHTDYGDNISIVSKEVTFMVAKKDTKKATGAYLSMLGTSPSDKLTTNIETFSRQELGVLSGQSTWLYALTMRVANRCTAFPEVISTQDLASCMTSAVNYSKFFYPYPKIPQIENQILYAEFKRNNLLYGTTGGVKRVFPKPNSKIEIEQAITKFTRCVENLINIGKYTELDSFSSDMKSKCHKVKSSDFLMVK
jgi:hypothetical protein